MKTTNNNNNYLGPWSDDNLLSPNLSILPVSECVDYQGLPVSLALIKRPELGLIKRPESDNKSLEASKEVILLNGPSIFSLEEELLINGRYKKLKRFVNSNLRYVLTEPVKGLEDIEKLESDLNLIENTLSSVMEGGFINDEKLSSYPILCDYLKVFGVLGKEVSLQESRILMRWFMSLLNLNLYEVCDGVIEDFSKSLTAGLENSEDLLSDRIHDLKARAKMYFGRISPSIREAMRKKSITITKNIYCGFDTEYEHVDMSTNKILSAQFAVSSKVLLSLPLVSKYEMHGMNTATGEEYPISRAWYDSTKVLIERLEGEVDSLISAVRAKRGYDKNDERLRALYKNIRSTGLPYYKSNGRVLFSYERSPTQTYFKTSDLEKLNLSEVMSIGLSLGSAFVDEREKEVISMLKENYLENIVEKGSKESVDYDLDSNFTNLKSMSKESFEQTELSSISSIAPSAKAERKIWGDLEQRQRIIVKRNFHLIGHLTQADLCFLTDFESISKNVKIIGKNLVTLGKSKISHHGYKLILNDTMLLAPGGKKSLAAIGSVYGYPKLSLSVRHVEKMSELLEENPTLFKEYALRDAVICLIHALSLEDAHFKLHKSTIPLTLSLLGGSNLSKAWLAKGYTGYQISKDTLLGDSRKTTTPKGLMDLGPTGLVLNNYIANYKGGRNESFMIGEDNGETIWKDYDLTAAYTTAMCMMGNPNYNLLRNLTPVEVKDMSFKELIYSYTAINVKFSFPEGTKYPSIPVYVDQTSTVYPLNGVAVLSGSEYILAQRQDCHLEVLGGTLLPYTYKSREEWEDILKGNLEKGILATKDLKLIERIKNLLSTKLSTSSSEVSNKSKKILSGWEAYKAEAFPPRELFNANKFTSLYMDLPFYEVISDLQRERKKYPKGTIENLLYKEMGNSLYGSVSKGISNKMKYDIEMGKTVRMEASKLSNPVMAAYTTSTVRSLIGTCMEMAAAAGGKIVSVTTDGFITDTEDLEKIIADPEDLETRIITDVSCEEIEENLKKSVDPIYSAFSEIREGLSGDPKILELKYEGKNLTSWTTRGQISSGMLNQEIPEEKRAGSGLKATTGFQAAGLDLIEVENLIKEGLSSDRKTISYISTTLKSAKDIVKSSISQSKTVITESEKLLDTNWYIEKGTYVTKRKNDHVTMGYRDQDFRLWYNNNRFVIKTQDAKTGLYDTKPWNGQEECLSARAKATLLKGSIYQVNTSLGSNTKYKSLFELGVREFIKYIFSAGLYLKEFKSYREIIDFINKYLYESGEKALKYVNSSYISEVKMRMKGKAIAPNRFLLTGENKSFFEYVTKSYPAYISVLSSNILRKRWKGEKLKE